MHPHVPDRGLSKNNAKKSAKSSAMRIVDFAVRSYLAILAVGYVGLCSALLSLVIH